MNYREWEELLKIEWKISILASICFKVLLSEESFILLKHLKYPSEPYSNIAEKPLSCVLLYELHC